jgi:hypothetical protein
LFHLTQFGGFRLRKTPQNIDLPNGFLEEWCDKRRRNGYVTYRGNAHFLSTFGRMPLRPLLRNWGYMNPVKVEEMVEAGFSADEIRDALNFMLRLNSFYSSIRLDIDTPISGLSEEDRIRLQRKFHGIPFLVKRPRAGGRLFHPESSYQGLGSVLRSRMRIDGQKVAEFDLSASVLQFLDICTGGRIGINFENGKDPYTFFLDVLGSDRFFGVWGDQSMSREDLKDILYTAIFSSQKRQRAQVNRRMRFNGRKCTANGLEDEFPAFFTALAELKTDTGRPVHQVVFREETRYAERVLQKGCLERGIPILPVHDSFITQERRALELEEVMNESSIELYGKELLYKRKY